jgi:F-type H+-transporting ATPase subunit gamma
MTRRHTLERQRDSLSEIREIMNSMKTLAYMETRKLARFLTAQQAALQTIETVAADFLAWHPGALPGTGGAARVCLLIGTERGFCGDFNQRLLRFLGTVQEAGTLQLVVIGRKLQMLFEGDGRVVTRLEGASVAEEVSLVLNRLAQELDTLQRRYGSLALSAVCQDSAGDIRMTQLLPAFRQTPAQSEPAGYAPDLNLAPAEFLFNLTEQYVFTALHERLYTSLMAENRNRVNHLDGAVKHLDETTGDLARRCSQLRQEEIIEEIEIILLSTDATT